MWKDQVCEELRAQHLFQSDSHRTRFKELLDCYGNAPFFTPGLCKCMYLSCWDEEHFAIMLDMLNQMKFGEHIGLDDMSENGELMAEEGMDHPYDYYVMQLSCAFLEDRPFDMEKLPPSLDPKGLYIIGQALRAAAVIDNMRLHGKEFDL